VTQKFAIGIPTINQWAAYLKSTVAIYTINFPHTDIFIIDNGRQGIQCRDANVHVSINPVPKSVAASWNQLSRLIFQRGYEYAFILNDDVLIERNEMAIQRLLQLHSNKDFFVGEAGYNSFILPRATFHRIGPFDENFKGAYFEDNDYQRRLLLAQAQVITPPLLTPKELAVSASVKANPSLNSNFKDNAAYYEKKWGGCRGGETFVTPFNQ
jgi:GT2 family glycosyltransferase